jgi:hypothetical protein
MEKIILDFQGPFRWHGSPDLFSQEIAKQKGIYLWTVEQPHGHLVYYVGETSTSFKNRFENHLKSYLSGEYGIPDANDFLQGKSKTWVWPAKWRVPDKWPAEFIQRISEIMPKLVELLGVMKIFVAPLLVETHVRQRIESTLAAYLKKQPEPIGSFIDADLRHSRDITNGDKFFVEINSPSLIQGIPSVLDVQIKKN